MPKGRVYRRRRFVKGRKLNKREKREVKMMLGRKIQNHLAYFHTEDLTIDKAGAILRVTPDLKNQLSTGSSYNFVSGTQIEYVSARYRMEVYFGEQVSTVRVIFFQWRPWIGDAEPTVQDIINPDPGDEGAVSIFSMYNYPQRTQYKIISDTTYVLCGNGTTEFPITTNSVRYINKRFKLHKKLCTYNNPTAEDPPQGDNQVYMLYISDSATDSTEKPSLSIQTEFKYKTA